MVGRIDLVAASDRGCELIEFKSGEEAAQHVQQLELYSVLWSVDREVNPEDIPIRALTLRYPHKTTAVGLLEEREREAFVDQVKARRDRALELVSSLPPPAWPNGDCPYCPVRQDCAAYWAVDTLPAPSNLSRTYVDAQLVLIRHLGSGLWEADCTTPALGLLVARIPAQVEVTAGTRLRALAVALQEGDDGPVLSVGRGSELFLI